MFCTSIKRYYIETFSAKIKCMLMTVCQNKCADKILYQYQWFAILIVLSISDAVPLTDFVPKSDGMPIKSIAPN